MIGKNLPILLLFLGIPAGCSWNRPTPAGTETWFREGVYVGATVGYSNLDASGGDLDDDLAALGNTSSSSLDDDDVGGKFYLGYRFDTPVPLSLEAAYVNLGQVESTISTNAANIDAFLADVADVHPFLGEGVSLRAQVHLVETERLELGLGAGAWFWEAEVDARGPSGQRVDIDDDGVDPVFSAFALYDINQILQVRLEYEKFFFDSDDADVVSIGLQMLIL